MAHVSKERRYVTLRTMHSRQRCGYWPWLSLPQRSCTAITLPFDTSIKATEVISNKLLLSVLHLSIREPQISQVVFGLSPSLSDH